MLPKQFLRAALLGFAILATILFLTACTGTASRLRFPSERTIASSRMVPRNYDYRRDYRLNTGRLMDAIQPWIGTPYCMGGSNRNCMDCSGFVQKVFLKVNGAKLPRTVKGQYKYGHSIAKGQLAPGDLLFFRMGRKRPGHVGIYIGNNRFAHASTSAGVTYTNLDDPYFTENYLGARRLF